METGLIFDIERFSIHDGPGIRTTVFFKGCSLSCSWCHNPESQASRSHHWFWERRCIRCGACVGACAHEAISMTGAWPVADDTRCVVCGECVQVCQTEAREIVGRRMSVAQVMAEIEKDVAFYDESGGGVTFSGGEPLMQPDFLLDLLRACKAHDIRTAVDTSGLAAWKTFEKIGPYVDLFLYDLKLMDDARHRRYTGVSNELILSNLRALAAQGRCVAVRVPLVPGINDDPDNIARLGECVASLNPRPSVSLLPYHKAGVDKYARLNLPYQLSELQSPSDARVAEIAVALQQFGLSVKVGG